MARIATMLASGTEIVAALGIADQIVAVSHECDYPPEVVGLPVCTESKIDTDGSSAEIDRRVKQVVEQSLSVYRVDGDRLRELKPEIIVTQTQCEVCAVSEQDVVDAVADWLDHKPEIVSLQPDDLAGIWRDIERVAAAAGVPERGEALVLGMRARMKAIADDAAALEARPRVAAIEWIDPLMAAGNWMPELVGMAAGINLFGEKGKHSPWMRWEDLAASDPDAIVVLPCGFDIERTRAEMPALTGRPGWADLKAVEAGRVFLTDGNQYFNRPGPRIAESLEILAEILHPESFDFGHEGSGWDRL